MHSVYEVDEEKEQLQSERALFWTFEYYQQFFDVNTQEVKSRIIEALFPRPTKNYLVSCIKPKPDLYGPFWICTTLIFTIAVSGNIANYFQYAESGNFQWKYDFHLISTASAVIFMYTWFVPWALWAFLKWTSSRSTLTFLELLCVYGYSMAVYVPVSILWVIQVTWFRWTLVMAAASLSALVLVTSLWTAVEGGKKFPVVAMVVALHFLLAVGFLECFFHIPDMTPLPPLNPPINVQPEHNSTVS